MKITLACNNPWSAGGQGNFLARASAALSQMGSLTVYCAGAKQPQISDFSVYPVGYSYWSRRLLATPILRRRSDIVTLLSDRYFDKQVRNHIRAKPCDLTVGVAGQSYLSLAETKAQGGKAWLYCLNSYLPFMQAEMQQEIKVLHDVTTTFVHPQMLKCFTKECELADLILLNSKVAKQTFIEAGISTEKLKVITPVVDPIRFHPAPKSDSVFRVLYVGTIDPRKGVHYLIPAFLQAQIPNSELLLAGGVSTRALRLLIADTLGNHANIKQELWDFRKQEPTQVFSRCSVLVLPSVEDGFGVVALEAMACGLTVIVTSQCGAADVVEDGINGFVVLPRDVGAIADKLTFLAANPNICTEMGKAARITAEKHTQTRYNEDMEQIFITQGLT